MSSGEAPEGRTVNSLTIILVKCAPEELAPTGLEIANLFFTCPLLSDFQTIFSQKAKFRHCADGI